MKVALEQGDTLEVAILEGDRVVGTLCLEMRSATASSVVRPAAVAAAAGAYKRGGRRGGKRNISPEARARMAEAQRRRWAKYRNEKGKK